jgi:hypothetical protein
MRLILLFASVIMMYGIPLVAQDNNQILLSGADVELFIQSYEGLTQDLKLLGEKYNVNGNGVQTVSAQAVNTEADSIFKKYGWGDHYMVKYSAVFSAFTYVALQNQLNNSPETFRKSMTSMLPEFKKATNDNDIQIVRSHFSELDALIGTPGL